MVELKPDAAMLVTELVQLHPQVYAFFEAFDVADSSIQNAFIRAFIKFWIASQDKAETAGEAEQTQIHEVYPWLQDAKFREQNAFAVFNSIISSTLRRAQLSVADLRS